MHPGRQALKDEAILFFNNGGDDEAFMVRLAPRTRMHLLSIEDP
jgi:hypothetical protein